MADNDSRSRACERPSAPVEYRQLDQTYATEAVVEAVRQSTISAQVIGRVVDLRVDIGARAGTSGWGNGLV